jgi:hypothetical protein
MAGARRLAAAPAPPPQPDQDDDVTADAIVATRMREAQREVHEAERKPDRKPKRGYTVRPLLDDEETLDQMAKALNRPKAYLHTIAVHMLCEAWRRNPRAIS